MESKELKEIYNITMGLLMKIEASNNRFFTQAEYEKNRGIISVIKIDFDKIEQMIKKG